MSIASLTIFRADYPACKELQSNCVNTGTEGPYKVFEFREKFKGFLSPGTKKTVRNNEVSGISWCP